MRGTVLLLDSGAAPVVDLDRLRENGLVVHRCGSLSEALERSPAPDVIVAVLAAHENSPVVPELRRVADPATSIIVAGVPEEREAVRRAGADHFLPHDAQPADLLYQIHRALILRRSGRRLAWD